MIQRFLTELVSCENLVIDLFEGEERVAGGRLHIDDGVAAEVLEIVG